MPLSQRLLMTKHTGSPPFSPLDIAGLTSWYDYSDISTLWKDTARTSAVTADGDIIKGVTDKSSGATHLSEATNGPTYKVSIQNGRSVARFDGSNDRLKATISADLTRTIFFAGRQRNANGAGQRYWVNINQVGGVSSINTTAQAQVASFSHLPAPVNFPGSIDVQTAAIYVIRDTSAASVDLYTNAGGSPVNGDPHDNWGTGVLMSFAVRDASSDLFGDIDAYEYLSYNSTLSVANINTLGSYLATGWGLSWTAVT